MSVITITTTDQLQQLTAQHKQVVIKFSTTTCGPCKAYNPIFNKYDEILRDSQSDIIVASSVLDTYPDVMGFAKTELGLSSIPVTVVYQDNVVIKKLNGPQNLQTLNSLFD